MKIGKSETERKVEKITESRNIVKEIIKFGINEEKKKDVIYFLAMELENNDLMRELCSILKNYRQGINQDEETEYNELSDNLSLENKKSKIIDI